MKKLISTLFAVILCLGAFAAGHVVTITSSNNCTCYGVCDGSATASVSGGVGPFTYDWTPTGGTGATASGLCAGSYTVTVTDNNDMSTATATILVNEPPLLTISLSGATICSGSCATLAPTGTGGTPPYTYNWSGGLFGSSPSACPPSTTTYTVTVSDGNACVAAATATVSVNPTPTISVPPSYTICSGACVILSASTTPGPSTYSWVGPGAFTAAIASPTICSPFAGTFTVTASYAGCTATATTTLWIDGPITSGITSTNTTSCGACDGGGAATPSGGTSPYSYHWSTGSIAPAVNFICAGTYSVVITDVMGCTTTDSTTVFDGNNLISNFSVVPDSTNAFNFFGFNTSTGTGNTYEWEWGDGVTSTIANPSHLYSMPGTYNVMLVANNALCGADTSYQTVVVTGTLSTCLSLFNIADDTTSTDPNSHYIYNLSYGASLTYLWDFGDGATSTLATPSHIYAATGPYNICLTIDNGSGCTQTYCDSLISADSLNRSSGTMQFVVYDVLPFQGLVTGIVNQNNSNLISVSKNPFSDNTTFTIQSNKNEIYSFELTDVLGKKVKSISGISEKQFTISRNELESGIYFYKIQNENGVVGIGKVIIK